MQVEMVEHFGVDGPALPAEVTAGLEDADVVCPRPMLLVFPVEFGEDALCACLCHSVRKGAQGPAAAV